MKKNIFILALALLPLLSLHGQEITEQLQGRYGGNSIIRNAGPNKWMIYSDNDLLAFSMVVDGTGTVDYLALPSGFSSVSDFTIYGNTVYFCGMLGSGTPVMGCFDLSTFPITPVEYCTVPVDTLVAIKVFGESLSSDAHRPQVVMIGIQNGMGILVDAVPATGGWDIYNILLLTSAGEYTVHTGLDVTQNHVIVASYKNRAKNEPGETESMPTALCHGYIWAVPRPASATTPMISPTVIYGKLANNYITPPFLVAACEKNAFVASAYATRTPVMFPLSHSLYVFGFSNVFNNMCSLRITDTIKSAKLKDICHDSASRTTELLTQYNGGSRIYSLNQSSPGTTHAHGHLYARSHINSLIPWPYYTGSFIGSGIEYNDNSNLYLYRYKSGVWGDCTSYMEGALNSIEAIYPKNGHMNYTFSFHEAIQVSPSEKETEIQRVCPSK